MGGEKMEELLGKLNEGQYAAVTSEERFVRVVAGAGSGKTRVLATRVAYLIANNGVPAQRILAITFTNKAALTMRVRVEEYLELASCAARISTYHSFCARFLREEIKILGYPSNFVIIDEDDQEKIIKKILNKYEEKIPVKPSSILSYISDNKTHRVHPDQAHESAVKLYGDSTRADIYSEYENYLKQNYYLDFDDLLLKSVEILENNPKILAKWAGRYDYILVDEFQDTNALQYQLLQLLTGPYTSVFVVGDPDQTIYTWRGADINIIMDFPTDFKPCTDYVLETNYRSSASILNCANVLIKNNKKRVPKKLVSLSDNDAKILCYPATSFDDEARWVAKRILELKLKNKNLSYQDIAVLYRSNYYSSALEKAMINNRIPYRIYGGVKFFQRMEVKDALSYLRVLVYDNDSVALDRIINVPKRGIGEKTLKSIYRAASIEGKHVARYLLDKYSESNDTSSLANFVKTIAKYREKLRESEKQINYGDLLHDLLLECDYIAALEENQEFERIENVHGLEKYLFSEQSKNPDVSLEEILQEAALYSAQDEIIDGEAVSLMTVHTAKGLEYSFVFVVGLSENVFPNARSINSTQALGGYDGTYEDEEKVEEERRLAYVALTRAKQQLFLCYNSGYDFTTKGNGQPSRFLMEIASEITPYRRMRDHDNYLHYHKFITKRKNRASFSSLANKKDFRPGEMVIHRTFGEGIILAVNESTFTIAFKNPKIGNKEISRKFIGLKKKGN